MLTPISQPTTRHLLADSSLLEKLLLVILDEITQHHIHLANECDGNIAYHFVGASGQNAIIVLAVAVFTAAFAGVIVTLVACLPQFQLMVGQVILIVFQQFLMAGLGDIEQFDLGLLAGSRCRCSLHDILLTRTGSLYHLIHRPISTTVQKMLAEIISHITDALRLPVHYQVIVAAILRQKLIIHFTHNGVMIIHDKDTLFFQYGQLLAN